LANKYDDDDDDVDVTGNEHGNVNIMEQTRIFSG